MQGKVQVLSQITNIIMEHMDIIGLSHTVSYDILVDKFDVDCKDEIQKLCEENGLTFNVIPFPYLHHGNYSIIKQRKYMMEKIGARIILTDPLQTEEVIPSIKEYEGYNG